MRQTTKSKVYYTQRWKRFRKMVLSASPLCVECEKRGDVEPGVDLDHIIPLDKGGAPYDRANVQPLCKFHHGRKTRREERQVT